MGCCLGLCYDKNRWSLCTVLSVSGLVVSFCCWFSPAILSLVLITTRPMFLVTGCSCIFPTVQNSVSSFCFSTAGENDQIKEKTCQVSQTNFPLGIHYTQFWKPFSILSCIQDGDLATPMTKQRLLGHFYWHEQELISGRLLQSLGFYCTNWDRTKRVLSPCWHHHWFKMFVDIGIAWKIGLHSSLLLYPTFNRNCEAWC